MGITVRTRPQLGTEKDPTPLPPLHSRPGTGALVRARLAIWVTIALWALYVFTAALAVLRGENGADVPDLLSTLTYVSVITLLTFSSVMYLLARSGAISRFNAHTRVPRRSIDDHFAHNQPPLTVLVPSYAEEPALVRQALLSAALQEYPRLEVVLLIDDAPDPADPATHERLELTRALPDEIAALLAEPLDQARTAVAAHEAAIRDGWCDAHAEMARVADAYHAAATWLRLTAEEEPNDDNVDAFLRDAVIGALARQLQHTADAASDAAASAEEIDLRRVRQLLQRLVWVFAADVRLFERKRYASLSHEANKAMNLNAYLGLMGGRFRHAVTARGIALEAVDAHETADVEIAAADYVLTLDADSLLLPEYALRLVYFLERPENARVAVAQTPYSSFRAAPTRLGRLASATTDVQHIIHQGLTAFDATFWVGANAVIRRSALEDLRVVERRNGIEMSIFVRDSTVIEDTESSIDLVAHGWSLYNYPERLSYSATPPDFGALVVQRRRWANGGLLVVPRLFAVARARARQQHPMSTVTVLLRLNYLASITWASLGLIFLMASFLIEGRLVTPWMFLIAVPYFAAMASDLHSAGYHRRDIVGVYGLNLLLLAVSLAGVISSLRQAMTGTKSTFARTPKVAHRTVATIPSIVVPYAIVAVSAYIVWRAIEIQAWGTVVFAGINGLTTAWAIVSLIGIRTSAADVWLRWTDWLWVAHRETDADAGDSGSHWRRALDEGDIGAPARAPRSRRASGQSAKTRKPVPA